MTGPGLLSRLQFASEGRWEEAVKICAGTRDPVSRLREWRRNAGQDVALEAFFGEELFLGLRVGVLPPHEQDDVISSVIESFLSSPPDPREACERMRAFFAEPDLFRGAPEFFELGKLDAWRSYGPLRFWERGPACSPASALSEALQRHPRFLECSDKPFAIEGGRAAPMPHWRGRVVSERCPGGWLLDPLRAREGVVSL